MAKKNNTAFPEIPDLEIESATPTVTEQTNHYVKELENKNNNLTQKIYQQEQEISQLRQALMEQETYFNTILARTVMAILGDR